MRTIFIVLILGSFSCANAQQTLEQYFQRKNAISSRGMAALGTWSMANITIGTYQTIKLDKSDDHYFHEMNAIWNTVNLSIAVVGIISSHKSKPPDSWEEMRKQQKQTETTFLINAGLDVVYMGGGLCMVLVGDNSRRPDIVKGFGESLILQGAYLLVTDIVQYTLHHVHQKRFMQKADATGQLIRF